MPLATTSTLAAAITSQGQAPIQQVTANFNRSGTPTDISSYVDAISLEQTLSTDLPDATRMVAGYAAGTGTFDLGGDKTNNDHGPAWTWSPTSTASPFYGKKRIGAPVVAKIGYITTAGREFLSRFTGTARSLDTSGSPELQAIDGSDRIRAQVLLPLATNLGHPGLDGRFFIDYILTQNGIDPASCDLEPSLNPLICTPYTSDKQDSWTLIQQIAAAEYATAFFDGAGKFHYWNRNHFIAQSVNYAAKTVTANGVTSPILQVTSQRALQSLTTTEAVDSIINHVIVNYTPYAVQGPDWVWQSTEPRGLHSGQTISLLATFDNPVQSLATNTIVLPNGGISGGRSAYRACIDKDGTGPAVENLQITITEFAQAARIDIHNPNRHTAFLVCPKADSKGRRYPSDHVGQPMLMLWGRPIVDASSASSVTNGSTGAATEASNAASIADHGEQPLTVDAGGWIQLSDVAQQLANYLLKLLRRPYAYLGDVAVVADPRLLLGDRIELIDGSGSGLSEHAWIVGITETFSASSGYTQALTLRLCNAIGSWVMGHPTRSQLGHTTVLTGVY